jgi:hypothetical protein
MGSVSQWMSYAPISMMLLILLSGCAKDQASDAASTSPSSCEEIFGVQVSEAHPAIKWSGPPILSPGQYKHCGQMVLDNPDVDVATIGIRDYLSRNTYKFLKECEEVRSSKNVIYRVFEKEKYKGRWSDGFGSRNLDVDGRPYAKYIVVESTPREKKGVYAHRIHERQSSIEKIISCRS